MLSFVLLHIKLKSTFKGMRLKGGEVYELDYARLVFPVHWFSQSFGNTATLYSQLNTHSFNRFNTTTTIKQNIYF